MKVALCLSGQPRWAKQCFPLIKSNIIDQHDTDVFCQIWTPRDNFEYKFSGDYCERGWKDFKITEDDVSDVINLYNPKVATMMVSEEMFKVVPLGDTISKYYGGIAQDDRARFARKLVVSSLGMYKGIFEANKIKEEYRLKTGTKYDYVIRARYDLIPNRPIRYDSMPDGHILYEELGQPDGMISDWLNIGSNDVMNAYSDIYSNWQYLVEQSLNKRNAWCNELLISEIMEMFGIQKMPQYWGLQLLRL